MTKQMDLRPLTSQMQVPWLVVAGEEDELSPVRQSYELVAACAAPSAMLEYQQGRRALPTFMPSVASEPNWLTYFADWLLERVNGKPVDERVDGARVKGVVIVPVVTSITMPVRSRRMHGGSRWARTPVYSPLNHQLSGSPGRQSMPELATGAHLYAAASATVEDVDRAIRPGRTAFHDGRWPRPPARRRSRILNHAAALLAERTDSYARSETLQIGRTDGIDMGTGVTDAGAIRACWAAALYRRNSGSGNGVRNPLQLADFGVERPQEQTSARGRSDCYRSRRQGCRGSKGWRY